MDYATKIIVMGVITTIIFLLLTQFELLDGLFNAVMDIGKAIITPIQNLLGNIF